MGNDGYKIFAIKEDGSQILWQRIIAPFREGLPLNSYGKIFAVDEYRNLHLVDKNGNILWERKDGYWSLNPAIYMDSILMIVHQDEDGNTYFVKMDVRGNEILRIPLPTIPASQIFNIIVDEDGTAYIASPDYMIKVLPNGDTLIRKFNTLKIKSPISMDEENIYAAVSYLDYTYLAEIGKERFSVYFPYKAKLGDYSLTATQPLISSEGMIYILTARGLYVFGKNLDPIWKYELTCDWFPTPVIGKSGNVYFGCNNILYSVDRNGNLLWFLDLSLDTIKVEGGYAPIAGLLLIRNKLIVTSANSKIYAIYVNDDLNILDPWPTFQRDWRRTGFAYRVPFPFKIPLLWQ